MLVLGSNLCENDDFPGGITNGAEWYVVKGGMQDFNYLFSNCFEITIEMSCCKYPLEDSIEDEWVANKESLLAYLESGHVGVKGIVKDLKGNPMQKAKIMVEGIDKPILTTESGEYWRLLAPGSYRIQAIGSEGYRSKFKSVQINSWPEKNRLDSGPIRLDFELDVKEEDSEIVTRFASSSLSTLAADEDEEQNTEENAQSSASASNTFMASFCYYLSAICGLTKMMGWSA